jgi:TetR/AcrR family transcriptional regulator, cholesterol catabolism regulator
MTGDAARQPPGRAERRGTGPRKPREERWSELLQVATQVFYEKGYDAASLQDIADRLGMLKGGLYYYITSKDDLLYTVISEVHRAGPANVESLAAAEGDAPRRLRGAIIGGEHAYRGVFRHLIEGRSVSSSPA